MPKGPGHYELRKVVVVGADGKRRVVTRRVWVPDPANPAAKKRTTHRRQPAGGGPSTVPDSVKRAAARRAAEERKRAARKALWDGLHKQADAARAKIAPPTVGGARRPAVSPNSEVGRSGAATAAAAAAAEAQRQEGIRWKAYSDWLKKKAQDKKDFESASDKKAAGTRKANKTLERLIAEAKAQQDKSGGSDLDSEYIRKLQEAYAHSANKATIAFQRQIARLDDLKVHFIYKDGKAVAIKPEGDYAKYLRIINSPEFKQARGEFNRLNNGQAQKTWDQAGSIAKAQRMRVYDLAKQTLLKQVHLLRQHGDTEAAAKILHDWNTGEKYLYEAAADMIDPAETSDKPVYKMVIGADGKKHSVLTFVKRTVLEEFEYRRNLYISEARRQYEEYQNQVQLRTAGQRLQQQRLNKDAPTARALQTMSTELADAFKAIGGIGDGPKSREDMNKTVEYAVSAWDKKNGHEWLSPETLAAIAKGGRAEIQARGSVEYQRYEQQLNTMRQRYYAAFGSEAPGLGENILNLPVLKQGLDVLGVGVGAIGGVIRIALKATTGSSQIDFDVPIADLPESVRASYNKWARDTYGHRHPGDKNPIEIWLETGDGVKWMNDQRNKRAAKSQESDAEFAGQWGGGFLGNDKQSIWQKIEALNTYGTQPTNNDIVNFIFSIGADPTNALPLKATTWMARLQHGLQVSKGADTFGALSRSWKTAVNFLHVTEPELRARRAFAPYIKAVDAGADPAQIMEMILADLAGIAEDGNVSLKQIQKRFRDLGIDPRLVNDHQILSLTQDALISKLKAAGVDYEGVAAHAERLLKDAETRASEVKQARSKLIHVADARTAEKEAIAKAAAEKGHAATLAEKQPLAERLLQRAARPVTERKVVSALDRESEDVLKVVSTTPGHVEAVYAEARAADPLRGNATPDMLQQITGAQDVVHVGDAQFAPGSYTDTFLQSQEYADLKKGLDAVFEDGRNKGKPDTKRRAIAEAALYEHGRRSIATDLYKKESKGVELVNGHINWVDNPDGLPYSVIGGDPYNKQYIATQSDLVARSGARTPTEEEIVRAERALFEQEKGRLMELGKKLHDEKITREEFFRLAEEGPRTFGVRRYSADLSKDIRSSGGISTHGVLDHLTLDDVYRSSDNIAEDASFIPVGDVMYQDLMSITHLNQYYETFSMLPAMMTGPGYETELMKNILNPSWRATFTRGQFTKLLSRPPFSNLEVGAAEFRATGAHLFALFHLTLSSGDLNRLKQYSRSIETILYNDPENIFARMWKVMETRAGVPWADGFIDSENAFMQAAILGKRLHPNMALAMIPYGPLARILPTAHGFSVHLAGLADTMNPIFRASPADWTDDVIAEQYTYIARKMVKGEEAMTRNAQVIHYIASRYGDVARRSIFANVVDDFTIEYALKAGGGEQFARALAFARQKAHELDDLVELTDRELIDIGTEIRKLRTKPFRSGQMRREYEVLRDPLDELYWSNRVTHDNPGLHTAKFLQKMQSPSVSRGNSWVRYANSYFLHMEKAGAADEARLLLRTLFEDEIARVTAGRYEELIGGGKSESRVISGDTAGGVRDFMKRAGLLDKDERVMKEGAQRKEIPYDQRELEQQLRNDKFIQDDAALLARAEAHAAKDDITALYDFSDFSFIRDQIEKYSHILASNTARGDAEEYIARLLNRVVDQTIDIESIPTHVGREMQQMVDAIKKTPQGVTFLSRWADEYATELYSSRLIDYLRHEDWFIDQERRGLTVDRAKQIAEGRDFAANELPRTGREGSIEKKMAAGDVAGSQADNVTEGVARGGTAESGGAIKADPPVAPDPSQLNSAKVSMAQRGLQIMADMSEEEWVARERYRAQGALRRAKTPEARSAARLRISNADKAFKVIEVSKSGGKGSYVPPNARSTFASTIRSVAGDRAAAALNPKFIAAYVTRLDGAYVEQARGYNRMLRNSPVDEGLGKVRKPGETSKTYTTHGVRIEAEFSKPMNRVYMKKAGFPTDSMDDLSVAQFITSLDDFEKSLPNPQFTALAEAAKKRIADRLVAITGDKTYTIDRWLDDRLVKRGEFMDIKEYERLDKIVQKAIQDARDGAKRTGQLDLRRRPGTRGENPLTELFESDVRAVIGKTKALEKEGVDPHAYNEARKVFRNGMLSKNTAQSISVHASKVAWDAMKAKGLLAKLGREDKVFRELYDQAFIAERAVRADEAARGLIEKLATDEMFGSSAEDIAREFENRYSLDQSVKGFEPGPITSYQRRSLEEAVKSLLDVTDVNDVEQMTVGLRRHGQAPPFENRGLMRDWLTKYGYWSPRTAEAIEAGKKSWSIQEEGKYYADNWGSPPEWADPSLLEKGGSLFETLHNEKFYGEVNRRWGLFNRNMQARFATGHMTREERARFLVEGSESLGIKGKRDLPLERKYVIERYGDLVTDKAGNLTAFPWLMNKEELGRYFVARSQSGLGVAEDLIQNADELKIVNDAIAKHIDQYFHGTVMRGKTVTYEDFFVITANITHDILQRGALSGPEWINRRRDFVGRFLRGQAAFRRALVFTQIGFLMNNVIDTQIKGPWTSFITRSFREGEPSARALSYGLREFGLDRGTQLLHDIPVHGTERFAATDFRWGKLLAITELPAQGAGMAENFTKLRLAQGMYDGAFRRAKAAVGDDLLADAMARKFVSEEVTRLWPTVGDGPIERLFNTISPFLSYQFKNHMVFIGELAGHPALYNYFNQIGNLIERTNRERWERDHPGEELPAHLARLIELPWAPGVFIDLGQFSDAQRGLKPLYDAVNGKITVKDFAAQFVRLVSANDQNIAYGVLNALHVPSHFEWVQGRDEEGFANGVWTKVEVPWEAPWGGTANAFNSLWPVQIGADFLSAMEGGFTVQEVTKIAYRTFFFGGLKEYDKGAGLNDFYFALRSTDPKAADEWLNNTDDGMNLKMRWAEQAGQSKEFYTPEEIKDILDPPKADPNPWLHSKSKEYQDRIHSDYAELRGIRAKWGARISELDPGSIEMRDAVLQAATERYNYYHDHPELYEYEMAKKTPEEWAAQLDEWKVDDLTQSYYNMEAPKAEDFKTAVAWQKAVAEWKKQRETFLKTFPQVAQRIGQTRDGVEGVWRDTEQHWFDVLDRIGTRSIAIEAAKQAKDFDLVDQLYMATELDFETLQKDTLVSYYDDSDFETTPYGTKFLKKDTFGNNLLPRLAVLPDFNKWRYDRATVEGKMKIERDTKYAQGMKEVIAKAKASDNFGATFVNTLKRHPWLLNEYFNRHPGKRDKWAANDEYIARISKFGIMMKAGHFTAGDKYFNNLPAWVKARYYEKHPARKNAIHQNLQYMTYMEKWVSFYKRRDYKGGADFFESMPKWVQDKYYAKHPDGFGRGTRGSSPYSRAMGKWVKLLQDNKDAEAKAYFDALPKEYKDRYYANHPEQELRNNIKRTGQLGEYFAADDANRALYLKAHPDFARWLAKQGGSEQTRRMMILAGYQALPKDNQWLRRVYREKYPEVFSKEAAGQASLKKTYGFLSDHPDMLPGFQKWLDAVWASYAENLKHTGAHPKPITLDHEAERRRRHSGRSAAWVRLHTV